MTEPKVTEMDGNKNADIIIGGGSGFAAAS